MVKLSVDDRVGGFDAAWKSEKHVVNERGVAVAVSRVMGWKAGGVVNDLKAPQGTAELFKEFRSCMRWGGASPHKRGNGVLVGVAEINVDEVCREFERLDK